MNNNFDDLLVAHRGESFDAPENTLESVNLAWANNVKKVEVDIHLTLDNQVIVAHDKDTFRTSKIKKVLADTNYADLKKLDVGVFKKPWKNIRIPLLQEILDTVPGDCTLIIEIKSDKKIIPFLKTILEKEQNKNINIEIISFGYDTISLAKETFNSTKCLWLLDLDYYWWNFIIGIRSKRLLEKLKFAKLDGANLYAGVLANQKFVKRLVNNDYLVYVWTVNKPEIAKKYIEWGATGITTDRPSWIKNQLEKLQ